jgi:hypothetical protein
MRFALAAVALLLAGCGSPSASTSRELPADHAELVTRIQFDLAKGDPDSDGITDLMLDVHALDDGNASYGWTGGLDVQVLRCVDPMCNVTPETDYTVHDEVSVERFTKADGGWLLHHSFEPNDAPSGHYQVTVWAKMAKTGAWHTSMAEFDYER